MTTNFGKMQFSWTENYIQIAMRTFRDRRI